MATGKDALLSVPEVSNSSRMSKLIDGNDPQRPVCTGLQPRRYCAKRASFSRNAGRPNTSGFNT